MNTVLGSQLIQVVRLQEGLHYAVTTGPYITQLYQNLYYPVTTEPSLAILQHNVSKFCKFIFFAEAVFDRNHYKCS